MPGVARLRRTPRSLFRPFAKDDHIIPPATSQALAARITGGNDEELALPGGVVGVFVGGKSQKSFAPPSPPIGRHDGASG